MRHARIRGSELIHQLHSHIMAQCVSSSHRFYFIEMLRSRYWKVLELEPYIEMGNQYFKDASPEDKGLWNYTIAGFYQLQDGYAQKSIHYYEVALSHIADHSSPAYAHILGDMSTELSRIGDHSRALGLAQKAKQLTMLGGDTEAQSVATVAEAFCHHSLGNFLRAKILCDEAKNLIPADQENKSRFRDELELDIYLSRTEYREAQATALAILEYASSCRPPKRDTLATQLNLALIGIAIGSDTELIKHYLDTAHHQLSTFVSYPPGFSWCDAIAANLHLREGNLSTAKEKFEKCFLIFQNSRDIQGIALCLDGMGDITHKMYDHEGTCRWAMLFLAFGMSLKSMVVTVSALRCIGEIFAARGDDKTAFNLLSAALHTFTVMDVHRERAKCMIGMGAILSRRGNLEKSVELWQTARVLLERSSSQTMDIARVDAMIQSAAKTTDIQTEFPLSREALGHELAPQL
ncbi:hypothetical protein C8R44DRAFT_855356 [Mycena epipterygia]|nr:hypothetical protein C8R44DRAFT_855356 [Mycena epipterygia]